MARGRQTGRIQVCDRTVDDTTEIIGADIEIDEGHANDIVETTQSSMKKKVNESIGTASVMSTNSGIRNIQNTMRVVRVF